MDGRREEFRDGKAIKQRKRILKWRIGNGWTRKWKRKKRKKIVKM